MQIKGTALHALLGAVLAASARGQEAPPSAQPTAGAISEQELAKSAHNPFEDFVKIPVQSTTGFDLKGHQGVAEGLNIAPLVPLPLNAVWDLVVEPSLSAAYLPSPQDEFGLGDLQTSIFLTPAKATTWIWGAGPIIQFPTASSPDFGTGRWSAGPTAALIYSNGPWFNGVLAYQLWSFAGNPDRGGVSQTFLEPDVSYNFDSGWYVQCEPSITYDWKAEAANAWTVPLGLDIGKAFKLGTQDLSWQAGAYDLLKRPDGAPHWIFRASLTFLFTGSHKVIGDSQ